MPLRSGRLPVPREHPVSALIHGPLPCAPFQVLALAAGRVCARASSPTGPELTWQGLAPVVRPSAPRLKDSAGAVSGLSRGVAGVGGGGMGCLTGLGLLVWFVLWILHGTPYLLATWDPWNVSLLVMAALQGLTVIGRGRAGRG